MTAVQPTLDEKIADLTNQLAQANADHDRLVNLINSEVKSAQDWAAAGNYTESARHKAVAEQAQSDLAAVSAKLPFLKEALKSLQDQKLVQIQAQNALVNQANAQAQVTASTANLTPEQQYQLQLSQIQAAQSAANAAASAKALQSTADDEKKKTTKYLIIGGIVFIIIVIAGIVIFKAKKA